MMVVGYVTRIPIIGAELNSLLQAYTGIYSCIQQRNNGIKGIVWIRHVMRKQEVNDAVQEVVIKQSDMVQEIIIINNSTQPHTACTCPLQSYLAKSCQILPCHILTNLAKSYHVISCQILLNLA